MKDSIEALEAEREKCLAHLAEAEQRGVRDKYAETVLQSVDRRIGRMEAREESRRRDLEELSTLNPRELARRVRRI